MSINDFSLLLNEFNFSNTCVEGIYGKPNKQIMCGGGTSGLAVVKERGLLPFPYDHEEVFCLKVIEDPYPLTIFDPEPLQEHREIWGGKYIPVYTAFSTSGFCKEFSFVMDFMLHFCRSVRGILDRNVRVVSELRKELNVRLRCFQDNKGLYDLREDLCRRLEESRKTMNFESIQIISSINGSVVDLPCFTGITIKHLDGPDSGIVIASVDGLDASNDNPHGIRFHDNKFLNMWKNRYVIIYNELSPSNVDSEDTVRRFITSYLEDVNSSLRNEAVFINREWEGLCSIIDKCEDHQNLLSSVLDDLIRQ